MLTAHRTLIARTLKKIARPSIRTPHVDQVGRGTGVVRVVGVCHPFLWYGILASLHVYLTCRQTSEHTSDAHGHGTRGERTTKGQRTEGRGQRTEGNSATGPLGPVARLPRPVASSTQNTTAARITTTGSVTTATLFSKRNDRQHVPANKATPWKFSVGAMILSDPCTLSNFDSFPVPAVSNASVAILVLPQG